MGTESFCRDQSGRSLKLTTDYHLVPRLRVSGDILSVSLYTFMACTETSIEPVSQTFCKYFGNNWNTGINCGERAKSGVNVALKRNSFYSFLCSWTYIY